MLKCWSHSTTTRNYAVTYYRTLEEILWQLGLEKLKERQTFLISLKEIVKIRIKLWVVGHWRGADREGGGNTGWGATEHWGGVGQ